MQLTFQWYDWPLKNQLLPRRNQASAQIAVWMTEGCKAPAGSSAGVGSCVLEMLVQVCQGSAPLPSLELQEQRWLFYLGLSHWDLQQHAVLTRWRKKKAQTSLSNRDKKQGDASHVLGVLRREQVSPENPNLGFVFSLPSPPLPTAGRACWLRGGWAGRSRWATCTTLWLLF